MMITEAWEKNESGVLLTEPLLLRANKAGAFGKSVLYPGGSIHEAMFTYLLGEPDRTLFHTQPALFYGKWLVCMSSAWEAFLKELPLRQVLRRVMMAPRCGPSEKTLSPLPEGYRTSPFTPEIFTRHPFGHGLNYRDYAEFERFGCGTAVLFGEKIASSASTFLRFEKDIELDVSTDPGHRRQGLADHCVFQLLNDCAARGLTVHWDAQNEASRRMAETHGFRKLKDYAVYVLGEK